MFLCKDTCRIVLDAVVESAKVVVVREWFPIGWTESEDDGDTVEGRSRAGRAG
jgi:hypothetical protein